MSFLDQIFFTRAEKLIKSSQTEVLTDSHNIELPHSISAYHSNWNESKINWSNHKKIYFSMIQASGKVFWLSVFYQVIASLCSFSTPLFIHQFMTLLQSLNEGKEIWSDQNIQILILLALGLGFSGAGHGLIIQHYYYRTLNFFQISTNITNKKIYDHSLKISQQAKQKNQVGEIVNLMSSDADAIGDIAITTIDLANSILLILGCSALLFYYIGWSALVAIVVMAALIPLTNNLAKKFTHLEEDLMKYRDQRISIMAQVLNSIRVVKYFSWEKSVFNEVKQVRQKEIGSRIKLNKAEILWGLIYVSISTVVLFFALYTHHLRGFKIDLPIVLTCISIFAVMEDQFGGLSRFISRFINIFVSGKRISEFLKSESTLSFATLNRSKQNETNNKDQIIFNEVFFGYNNENLIFKNLSFRINKGESIAVVGAVASGKTTLLNLILNEFEVKKGQVIIPDHWKIAFQSQEPFILNASLRDNIIFGANDVTDEKFEKVLNLTALSFDIRQLPYGLDTEIGEKGVNLSGGQKQRVCLARCLLANPDLILMDDPLSAVDVHTESELCEKLIFGEWKNKTQIVTTHRIAHLKKFDRILFLNQGHFVLESFERLMMVSPEFKNFIDIESENQKSDLEIKQTEAVTEKKINVNEGSRITVDEDRVIGSVDSEVYKIYIRSLGGQGKNRKWILFFIFLSAVMTIVIPLLQKSWLTQFNTSIDTKTLVLGYGLLGLLTMLVYFINSLFWMWRGIKSGSYFHDITLSSLLKADIRFFDSTPVGRILQRFSRDVESVDVHIQWTFEQTLNAVLQVALSFLLIVITLPLTIIFLMPVITYYYFLQNNYRRTAREVKRLDSLARSPRYSHFKETLQGLSVIRAFKKESFFQNEFLIKLQKSTQAFYNHLYLNRWFSTRLPLVGALISCITVLAIVFSSFKGWISAGLAGLVTLYALQFWRYLNWGIRIFSDLETRMTSVERLHFYQGLLPEKSYPSELTELVPQTGKLEFKNVALKYADHLPLVLKNVSFQISSGFKVGIIGRTGSGKSTLFQAVYRFVEFNQGDILIDDQSIRNYSLYNLRRSLAVIPQDPSLFMGTLRSNLDRYSEKSDSQVLAVLEKVGLFKFVMSLPEQLSHQVSENGSNLSQGQRQLICLARALLMEVKIIFLDEATASVDVETDAMVQKVIQNDLNGITLVTIAHRLSTLKGYDQIIELDQGSVV